MSTQRWSYAATLVFFAWPAVCCAEIVPVSVSALKQESWVGQKTTFHVTVRGEGPFASATSFSLPQISRCVIVKVGSPVVGTEEHDGAPWYTQTHEFALFSQREGTVKIPPFPVRFSNKKDPDSKPVDRVVKTEPLAFTIKRPDGADADAFVITTTDITITEQWDPSPGPTLQGAVFHRTITQVADDMTGMALAPPPTSVSDGVRVHPDKPIVSDRSERGDLRGSRSDTITYVLESAGSPSVPAIRYVWWDPDKEEFGSKTLPAVTFDVAAAPNPTLPNVSEPLRRRWWLLGIALAVFLYGLWRGRRLAAWLRCLNSTLNPPERMAARRLMSSCRRNDASGAEAAWLQWSLTQCNEAPLPDSLHRAVGELNRHLYGPAPPTAWKGDALALAFSHRRTEQKRLSAEGPSNLPRLNPTGRPVSRVLTH